jgi:hypothetical protein
MEIVITTTITTTTTKLLLERAIKISAEQKKNLNNLCRMMNK